MTDQQKKLRKANVALVRGDAFGRRPTAQDIERLTRAARMRVNAVLGLHVERKARKRSGQRALVCGISMQIGYARVSTHDQNLDLQRDALTKAGCAKLFTDTISGANADRPGLAQALDFARDGDILVVWKLDRLGRSLRDLIATITTLHEKGVGFKSITESIDTTTPGGKLIFQVFGALAEFERDLIRERTHAGLSAARARGKVGGRPRVLSPKKVTQLQALTADRTNTIADILDTLNISRTTYYRYVKAAPATED